ncbi:MAG: sigma-70 family RNA polymerase sigma factor [Acidobacteriota bacterium]
MTTAVAPGREALPWRQLRDQVKRFVARRLPAADAEDVAQDVLVRLLQNADKLVAARQSSAWVYGVARNAVADYFRARRPDQAGETAEADRLGDEDEHRGFAEFGGSHSVHEEVVSWLRPMVDDLPEKYREPLLLADFEGRKQREVATELGLSVAATKSRIQRARVMLGEQLRACCEIALDPDGRAVDFERKHCGCH